MSIAPRTDTGGAAREKMRFNRSLGSLFRPSPWLALYFSAALLVILGGCTAIAPAPVGKQFERNGVSMVVIPDNLRETYFNDPNSTERHCRAPSSDVSVTASEGVSLGLPTSAIGGSGGPAIAETSGIGAVALGGRNPSVLITRELMYRACEFTSNLDLPFDKALQVYERFLKAIEKITASQTGEGTAGATVGSPPTVTAPAIGPILNPASNSVSSGLVLNPASNSMSSDALPKNPVSKEIELSP